MVRSTPGLVWSRARYDWRRHVAALGAVAVLMASFLTFDALAAGMEQALAQELTEGGHDRVQFSTGGFASPDAPSIPVDEIRSWAGVEAVHARSATTTGLAVNQSGGNATFFGPAGSTPLRSELVLVGIDAAAEAQLVEAAAGPMTSGAGFRVGPAKNYSLLDGTWIGGPGQAVATLSASNAGFGLGTLVSFDGQPYEVVGVIDNLHAANLNVPDVRSAGQFLVDRAGLTWEGVGGVFIEVEPEFVAVQSVSNRLINLFPQQTGALRADLADLERQHYEQARSQAVLAAAGRLVGLAGAATLFAMGLFLLVGERKSLGAMAAVGFSRRRLASYMGQKLLGLAIAGCLVGGLAGMAVAAALELPTVSFESQPVVDAATYAAATIESLAAALAGVFVAFLLIIRKNPIEALTAAD